MDRREFLAGSVAAGAALRSSLTSAKSVSSGESAKFKLKYAPNLNTFKAHVGKDPIENIKFAADHGFRAMFDNGFMSKSADLQKKIIVELANHEMDFGPFVLYPNFKDSGLATNNKDSIKAFLQKVKEGVEVCKRNNLQQMLVVPGRIDQKLEVDYQTANLINVLRRMCEILEKDSIVVVLEPLNRWNHPGQFLSGMPQAYMITSAVNHPCCKIVDDLYHQQITEGNLIPNIDRAWDQIATFHIGDNPGRKEPGTGEINYRNVFKHIHKKGFDGVLCCEHGHSIKGQEGEKAFIEAYRWADNF